MDRWLVKCNIAFQQLKWPFTAGPRIDCRTMALLATTLVVVLQGCSSKDTEVGAGITSPEDIRSPTENPVETHTTPPEIVFDPSVDALVLQAWQGLDQTQNTCSEHFDYHPNGGMKIFACHLFSWVTYERFAGLASAPIFVKGPHTEVELDLEQAYTFGHYNPFFVDWLIEHAVPGAEDEVFREATQSLYDQYVQPLAQVFAVTYSKIEANPDCFALERDRYKEMIESQSLPFYYYRKFFYFMNDGFCHDPDGGFESFKGDDGGYSGNVVQTATAFWIRRSLDGTMDQFYRGLVKLRSTYER